MEDKHNYKKIRKKIEMRRGKRGKKKTK